MFTKVSHRAATHSSGFKVYSIDFYTIAYEDDMITATLETDFLDSCPPIYSDSLKTTSSGHHHTSPPDSDEIIRRISQALKFLGINHEIVTDSAQ
jgi:hypothetical protein